MGEFAINGTRNFDLIPQADVKTYKPAFTLPGSIASGMKSDYGDFLFQTLHIKNCSLWLSDYKMKEAAVLYGVVDDQVLELHCMLSGGMLYRTDGFGMVNMPQNTFNLHQQPYVKNQVFLPKNGQATTFNIRFEPEYLYQFCSFYPQLDRFIEQTMKKQFFLMHPEARPLTVELSSTIQSILNAPLRPDEQLHILSAAIHTFVLQALSYLTDSSPPPIKITTQHREMVEAIKTYIQKDLDEHTLIPDLARLFGINDCQLKAIFKTITGTSIFQFLTRERMTKASWLLKNTDVSIEEIAFMVGYKDASGFSYRFKRLYLLSPLQYRNSK